MAIERIPLAEVVGSLRTEIADAMRASRDEALRFRLGPVDVELTVVAKREGGANGKVKFSVLSLVDVEAGGDGKRASEFTQKIKLTLTPVRPGGPPDDEILIGDKTQAGDEDAEKPLADHAG